MSKDKVLLGRKDKQPIYLYKHQWDCEWYWSMGYLGNANNHCHFEQYLKNHECYNVSVVFDETGIKQGQWWILLDLFKQAYALKHCAEIYQYGGHMTTAKGLTDIIHNKDKAAMLNKDLEIVLDKIWEFVNNIKIE